MKRFLMIALLISAIPAVAVGQSVSCDNDACSHEVSVYMGEGGLIASTDADEVTYVATCNGVTRSGSLMPNEDGVVAMLLEGDLACHGDDKASFKIGPIDDGGWYWITMDTNSAVGGLVSMDILENDTVDIADAGEGVEITAGSGAVLLSETATGSRRHPADHPAGASDGCSPDVRLRHRRYRRGADLLAAAERMRARRWRAHHSGHDHERVHRSYGADHGQRHDLPVGGNAV